MKIMGRFLTAFLFTFMLTHGLAPVQAEQKSKINLSNKIKTVNPNIQRKIIRPHATGKGTGTNLGQVYVRSGTTSKPSTISELSFQQKISLFKSSVPNVPDPKPSVSIRLSAGSLRNKSSQIIDGIMMASNVNYINPGTKDLILREKEAYPFSDIIVAFRVSQPNKPVLLDFAVEAVKSDIYNSNVQLISAGLNINQIVDVSNNITPSYHFTVIATPLDKNWQYVTFRNISDKKINVRYCELTPLQ